MATQATIPTTTAASATPIAATIPTAAIPGSATANAQSAANPFAPAAATVPTSTASTAANAVITGTVQSNGINWNDGSDTVTGDFKDTYGAGTGTAITDVLQNLGTSTDSAVQATIANTNLEAGKQAANITSGEAASGVTANSSTAALAQGDFYSGVNSNLQSTVANMELGEENTLLGALTNEGSAHGSDSSFLGTLGDVLSGSSASDAISAGANALNSTGASGTGTFSEILSALG
jgi:hypothetical protein